MYCPRALLQIANYPDPCVSRLPDIKKNSSESVYMADLPLNSQSSLLVNAHPSYNTLYSNIDIALRRRFPNQTN